jgi:DNA-directed RNA polymerase specialized sigma24 family protein
MSAESVKALDDFGDALGHLKTSAVNILGQVAAAAIRTAKTLAEAAHQAAQETGLASVAKQQPDDLALFHVERQSGPIPTLSNQRIAGFAGDLAAGTAAAKTLAEAIRAVSKELDLQAALADAAGLSLEDYQKALEAINHKIQQGERPIVELTQKQQELTLSYQSLGLSNEEIALKLGVSERSVASYSDSLDELLARMRSNREETAKVQVEIGKLAVGFGAAGKTVVGFHGVLKATDPTLLETTDTISKFNRHLLELKDIGQGPSGTMAEFRKETDKANAEAEKAVGTLDDLARGFAQLATVAGGSLGGAVRQVAQMVTALDTASKSVKEIQASRKTGSLLGEIVGVAGLAASAVSLLTPIIKAFHKSEAEKFAHDVGRDLGVQISDGLAKQLEADSKKFGRQATSLLHLDEIINEAGGVQSFGLDKAIKSAHDLFSMLETGKLSVTQVGSEFDKVFGQILPSALDKVTGLGSKAFNDLTSTARKSGIKSDALNSFDQGQLKTGVLGGIGTFLGASNDAAKRAADDQKTLIDLQAQLEGASSDAQATIQAAIEKTTKDLADQQAVIASTSIHTQGAADAVAGSILGVFAQLQKSGVSFTDALTAVTPAVNGLEEQLARTGTTGGAAFGDLERLVALAGDSIAGPAINAVNGLGQALSGLENTGLLTQATFDGLTSQITDTFATLTAQGKGGDDALKLMQPTLQTIFELQTQFGFSTDAATQALLDQAEAAGIVGEKFKTPQQQMIDALGKTNDILSAIADKLGAKLPEAAGLAAKGISDELAKITVPKISIPWDLQPAPGNVPVPDGAASGGLVTANGIQHFTAGGRVLPFFRRGTDSVPALLTPGEIVLNAAQQANVAAVLSGSAAVGKGGNVEQLLVSIDRRLAIQEATLIETVRRVARDTNQRRG